MSEIMERIAGVQIGGLWAAFQVLELTALVLVILWVMSKIELPDTGDTRSQQTQEGESK
jgi:hypothetical protein